MRIQCPSDWAGKTLNACLPGGDPFRVAFDGDACANVTPEQAAHLEAKSGLRIARLPDGEGGANAPLSSEIVVPPASASDPAPAEILTPAKVKAKASGKKE